MKSIPFHIVIKVNEKSFIFLLFFHVPVLPDKLPVTGLDSAGDCYSFIKIPWPMNKVISTTKRHAMRD